MRGRLAESRDFSDKDGELVLGSTFSSVLSGCAFLLAYAARLIFFFGAMLGVLWLLLTALALSRERSLVETCDSCW